MYKKITFLSIFVTLFLFSVFYISNVNLVGAKQNENGDVRLIVKYSDGSLKNADENNVQQIAQKHHGKKDDQSDSDKTVGLNVSKSDKDSAIKELSNSKGVEIVEEDLKVNAFFSSNDTYFPLQWGLNNIGQNIGGTTGLVDADIDYPEATYAPAPGSVLVAVLDTGINSAHEDLVGKVVKAKSFVNTVSGTNDIVGHGTHVAGIIAANSNNAKGVAGVCPNCQLMNVKVLDDTGSGYMSTVANGLIWAVDNGAKVVNMSLGSTGKSALLEYAINYAWSRNVVVVAAAGNSGNSALMYPAAYTNAIAVAATTNQDVKASFSSYGSSWVDVAAPGLYIASTWNKPGNGITCANPNACYVYLSGTSMASPFVAGIAGVLWNSPYGTDAVTVRNRIENSADAISGTGLYWSKGRVNLANALSIP